MYPVRAEPIGVGHYGEYLTTVKNLKGTGLVHYLIADTV